MANEPAKEPATKDCPCTICGESVTVTKFATAAKVKCESCKKEIRITPPEDRVLQYATWADVHDPELRNLCCLSCGEDLVLINVIRSDRWGDIVRTQCPSCFLVMQMSEQGRQYKRMLTKVPINQFSGSVSEQLEGMPDIDTDVANSLDAETAQYIREKYGDDPKEATRESDEHDNYHLTEPIEEEIEIVINDKEYE